MFPDLSPAQLAIVALIIIGAITLVMGLLFPLFAPPKPELRLRSSGTRRTVTGERRPSLIAGAADGEKDALRRKVIDALRESERRERSSPSLRLQIARAGLTITVRQYWITIILIGAVLAVLPVFVGLPWFVGILTGITGVFGLPRWYLAQRAARRQAAFREGLPDAVEIMVRGLKAGLPLNEALRMIASEAAAPIGPEFLDIVEGQRVGVTIDQGLARVLERMPLAEVSFIAIVINIQLKTGGNLSEALGNLAKVLRDRKKMKAKIRAASQEARDSALIIGLLPFFVIGALIFLNFQYVSPLLFSDSGRIILAGSALWMAIGIAVMRWMIRFEI